MPHPGHENSRGQISNHFLQNLQQRDPPQLGNKHRQETILPTFPSDLRLLHVAHRCQMVNLHPPVPSKFIQCRYHTMLERIESLPPKTLLATRLHHDGYFGFKLVLRSLKWPLEILTLNLFYIHVRILNLLKVLEPRSLTDAEVLFVIFSSKNSSTQMTSFNSFLIVFCVSIPRRRLSPSNHN